MPAVEQRKAHSSILWVIRLCHQLHSITTEKIPTHKRKVLQVPYTRSQVAGIEVACDNINFCIGCMVHNRKFGLYGRTIHEAAIVYLRVELVMVKLKHCQPISN
jgi:hypothetical protein